MLFNFEPTKNGTRMNIKTIDSMRHSIYSCPLFVNYLIYKPHRILHCSIMISLHDKY